MNHTGDKTMGFYTSGIIGVDTQSMIRGKPQRAQFMEKHISMMGKRRLDAPQAPGAQLAETAEVATPADDNIFDIVTASGRYSMKRQARHKAYWKKREDFYEDRCKDARSSTTVLDRSASRYLRSLWKFDPDHEVEIHLNAFIESMVKVANPQRARYHYRSAAPFPNNCCAVCNKQLDL